MTEHTIPLAPVRPDAVTLVSCGDANFTAPTGVLFRSVMDRASPGRFYDLIYLHNGADPAQLEQLRTMAEGMDHVCIRTCDIRPIFPEQEFSTENRKDISPMTYARLLIPEILGSGYHRAVYLDGDMIALRDVAELYDADLQGKPLGSTVDFGFLSAPEENRAYAAGQILLDDPEEYIMAAVLVMDLDRLRSEFPSDLLLDAARSRDWIWHDQDVINHVLRGRICHLDPRWDVIVPDGGTKQLPAHWRECYDAALESPFLFHFAGSRRKPWKNTDSPYAGDFWDIAARTPFYDTLFFRLSREPGSYERLYRSNTEPPGGFRRLLRRILPPPADSVQRDLRNLLDTIDTQTRMYLTLLIKLAPGTQAPAPTWEEAAMPVQPAFRDGVTVVCCGDRRFAAPAGVLIRSVTEHADPNRSYDILYLHNGLPEETKAALGSLAVGKKNISIRLCDIRPGFSTDGLYTENRKNFSTMAYARLLIPAVLGSGYHRALYLDGDMIAFDDVAQLHDADLAGKAIGACTDLFYAAEGPGPRRSYVETQVGAAQPEQYINSGMLVMDLDRLRQDGLDRDLMALAGSRNWQWHDQDVVNRGLRGNIQLLDVCWNCFDIGQMSHRLPEHLRRSYEKALGDPRLFHFAGAGEKPWVRPHPRYAPEFWAAARNTPFYTPLLRRLHQNLNTYETANPSEGVPKNMLKRILKKILPPPVQSVQRDLKTVLDAIDEQRKLGLLLMQQIDERKGGPSSAPAVKVPRMQLRFEFSLASHCNLNCAGCSHFAPLAEEEYPDLEQTRLAFARLSSLFGGQCEYIHLMGGEPLLNPQCEDYLRMAREAFPIGQIQLVTNGLLLMQMPDHFYEICRDCRITISLTRYPIGLDHAAAEQRCAAHGVCFESFRGDVTCFNRYILDPSGSGDPEQHYLACPHSNSCLFLYRNRMYPCGIGAHLRLFENHFHRGLELTQADSVDIFSVQSGSELLYRLAKAVPMCRYCAVEHWQEQTPWKQSQKDIGEWT